jgi:hypothetical protein
MNKILNYTAFQQRDNYDFAAFNQTIFSKNSKTTSWIQVQLHKNQFQIIII